MSCLLPPCSTVSSGPGLTEEPAGPALACTRGRLEWWPVSPVGLLLNLVPLLPPGSPSPASRLQPEHHLYQLDESLAGLEQTGGGKEGSTRPAWGEALQRREPGPP